jgi:hypothetical protein
MEIIEIKTLIDVTSNLVSRVKQATQLELDQTRNFTTLRQCLELRALIAFDTTPIQQTIDINDAGFGEQYKGTHNVWTFVFRTDRSGFYLDDTGNQIGYLIEDIHLVPIIKNLNETINIEKAVFDTKNIATKNTIIKAL